MDIIPARGFIHLRVSRVSARITSAGFCGISGISGLYVRMAGIRFLMGEAVRELIYSPSRIEKLSLFTISCSNKKTLDFEFSDGLGGGKDNKQQLIDILFD